jgi:hypothetical protein
MMPRYELRTAPIGPAQARRVIDIIPRCFPEIEVIERRYDDTNQLDVWICRAPSIGHLERWASASALPLATPGHSEPSNGRARGAPQAGDRASTGSEFVDGVATVTSVTARRDNNRSGRATACSGDTTAKPGGPPDGGPEPKESLWH